MKKSEIYRTAILCVIGNEMLDPEDRLEIVEQLLHDKHLAGWTEEHAEDGV